MSSRNKVLLFSTLNPYPFWAGSEKYWFDFICRREAFGAFDFHVVLADSPVTRAKGKVLETLGIGTTFYRHFNVDFVRRNIYKVRDKFRARQTRTLPWYDEIDRRRPDLVWFCVSTLTELTDLSYAVNICSRYEIPYWILVQHGYEDLFFSSEADLEAAADVAISASTFIFIAERNRLTLERAICRRLPNAFHSSNTLPQSKMDEAEDVAERFPVDGQGVARFFNLGRFSPADKGQHLLVEAFAQPQWKEREWTLTFVGLDDFGRKYLERLAGLVTLDVGRLRFVPFVEEVFAEIARHDVLLMPSLAEGTPYALIESMACGRPAMGTPVGGIPELVLSGKTGWLARTTDIVDVEDALEKMWADRPEFGRIGENARQFVNTNYKSDIAAQELLDRLRHDTSHDRKNLAAR